MRVTEIAHLDEKLEEAASSGPGTPRPARGAPDNFLRSSWQGDTPRWTIESDEQGAGSRTVLCAGKRHRASSGGTGPRLQLGEVLWWSLFCGEGRQMHEVMVQLAASG
jgi:hypothetical protein